MFNWLHRQLNPHCPHCVEETHENKVCQSCETLKMQLSIANDEKRQMLNTILSFTEKPKETSPQAIDPKLIHPKAMTWNVRKQMLEAEDRKAAQLLAEQRKNQKESIDKLEEELGIKEGVASDVQTPIQ